MASTTTGFIDLSRIAPSLAIAFFCVATPTHSQTLDSFDVRANDTVLAIAQQPDGKIVFTGYFTEAVGQSRINVARVHWDGSLDTIFKPETAQRSNALVVQEDGKILLGGWFSSVNGQSRKCLARLNADGTLDEDFNPGANNVVWSLVRQPDGKILVAGGFGVLAGAARSNLGRINADGTIDDTFTPVANDEVYSLALQPDGKILVGGRFTSLADQPRNRIGRLNSDGSLDLVFNPGANSSVFVLTVQPDGGILAGGSFTSLASGTNQFIGRLNQDGSLDTNFMGTANGSVNALSLQVDGKILVGGYFTNLSGQSRKLLGRLNADGTLDTSFNADAKNNWVSSITVQKDGGILVGGYFDNLANQTCHYFGRLNNTGVPSENLIYDGTNLTWLRGGTGPEVWRTTFDVSSDGENWLPVSGGARISGGWQVTNVVFPASSRFRARGFTTGGFQNSSSGFVETRSGAPSIIAHPEHRTNNATTAAFFQVTAGGDPPFTYQWLKNGIALDASQNLSGVTTDCLKLTNLFGGNTGFYQVVVSNGLGSVTSSIAILQVADPFINKQPTNQFCDAGKVTAFNVGALGTPPLSYQWRKDGTNLPNKTGATFLLVNVKRDDIASYDAVVTNPYGTVTSAVATLSVNLSFADSLNLNVDGPIFAMAMQTDGKLVLGGSFTSVASQPRNRLARINADGTLDPTFNPGANNSVLSLSMQTDGKILVGGVFTSLAGASRSRLGRLNANGTIDTNFTTGVSSQGVSLAVNAVMAQPDGKILVGGDFGGLGGQNTHGLGRLNGDGSVDASFYKQPYTGIFIVHSLATQQDGKILVGGLFGTLRGQLRDNLGRLNEDGTLDTNFIAGSLSSAVYSLAVQRNGQILIGGRLDGPFGQTNYSLRRINSDGTRDMAFTLGTVSGNDRINSFACQADGRILVAGSFTNLGGQPLKNIGRIKEDGSLDSSFNPGGNSNVNAVAVQPDGKILVGGNFSVLAGQVRNHLGRLENTDPASEQLSFDSTSVTWLRSGSAPEFWVASFEFSTNGHGWINGGPVQRIDGGWFLSGLSLDSNSTVRARGFVAGGYQNNSTWFEEVIMGPPVIVSNPVSRTNIYGTAATFSVQVEGPQTIAYQWYKGGVALTNGGNIAGANANTLTLSNVSGAFAAEYYIIATNHTGTITSLPAVLSVIDPLIVNPPTNRTANLGQTLTAFSVVPNGSAPFGYQWRKNGTNISWATTNALTITNVQRNDAANYEVIVANAFGSVTSVVAHLAVNLIHPDLLNPNANNNVYPMVPQPDGKFLLGGDFTMLGGQPRNRFARLNADGSLDTNFNPNANGVVFSLVVQPDGKILAGGGFTTLGGQTRTRIARLNPDGTTDTNFNSSANNLITALVQQSDGKTIAGGHFTMLAGHSRNYLGRVNHDGTRDTNFNPTIDGLVYPVALQPDGKILLGGNFTSLGGQAHLYIGRLNQDGTVDTNFNAAANSTVRCLALQSDGKIILGGAFGMLGGQIRGCIGRLNADGTLDTNFNASANNTVHSLAIQTDGRILVSGDFTNLNGQARNFVGRFNSDGTLDNTFFPSANSSVYSSVVQADGEVLIGGAFVSVNGQTRRYFARLHNSEPAVQNLFVTNGTITWSRTGSSPEIWRAIFESSSDGTNWMNLGEGQRTNDSWRLETIASDTITSIRARGFVAAGRFGGSVWFDENTIQLVPPTPPNIVVSDGLFGFLSNRFGFNIAGNSGQEFIMEASTNFSDWISLSTNTFGIEPFYFSDSNSTSVPRRFYRVRIP